MRTWITLLALAACGGAAEAPAEEAAAAEPAEEAPAATSDGDWASYGDAFEATDIVAARQLLDDPEAYDGKTVTVEGRVADVCQKAGCWMVIADGADHMRVRMKDHDFSVAKDGTGSTARVHGQVVSRKLDPKEVEHFASEASEGAVVPEDNAEGDTVYEMVASGVQMKKDA